MHQYKPFHAYQDDLVLRMIRALKANEHPFLVAVPGAGKTTMVHAVLSHIIKNKVNGRIKALITTPQLQINEGFLRNHRHWSFCGANHDLLGIHETIYGSSLTSWLRGKNQGIALCCNASIANKNSSGFNPFSELETCNDIVWVIDEAHHSEAPGLKKVIQEFLEKLGKIIYITATPFNASGILDALDKTHKYKVRVLHRSLAEHMDGGFCPEVQLEHCVMSGDTKTRQVSLQNADYNEQAARIWAKHIAKKFIADGKPKTLVIIPPTRKSKGSREDKTTLDTADELIKRIKALVPNVSILNTVGFESSDNKITSMISAEATGETDHDIIVACKRFDEGTDVKNICAVYIIGMCSDRLAIQRMGRAMRSKKAIRGFATKHPEYTSLSKLVFFLFENSDDRRFAEQAVRVIAAVESYSSYKLLAGTTLLKQKLREVDPEDDETYGAITDHEVSVLLGNIENPMKQCGFSLSDEDATNIIATVRNTKVNVSSVLAELIKRYAKYEVDFKRSKLMEHFTTMLTAKTIREYGIQITDTVQPLQLANARTNALCDWMDAHGRMIPTQYSSDPDEQAKRIALHELLTGFDNYSMFVKREPKYICYQEVNNILQSRGYNLIDDEYVAYGRLDKIRDAVSTYTSYLVNVKKIKNRYAALETPHIANLVEWVIFALRTLATVLKSTTTDKLRLKWLDKTSLYEGIPSAMLLDWHAILCNLVQAQFSKRPSREALDFFNQGGRFPFALLIESLALEKEFTQEDMYKPRIKSLTRFIRQVNDDANFFAGIARSHAFWNDLKWYIENRQVDADTKLFLNVYASEPQVRRVCENCTKQSELQLQ